ncbi:DHH family phosphoesterase [Shewanella dokdonensis]|uniref:DHH family phosphoesterase n=1 Tax=Shewanella dokdonensis TaxID=712036 RepID=A0ABX8DFV7_9GAMM|nr:DHH family phosphoesterase [Shewanella dokdonensis]MCL1073814.1 DHH family phosphoesterase [Shewanella dokdonensis]QVK23603.1 DHH family phosphoesterase [Shewanella dokdonensis]
MHYDVFNGDADGILSLVQLRLLAPREAVLVTGVKRDISLLQRVSAAAGDTVQVLDISLEQNLLPLQRLLQQDVAVDYIDHHRAGEIPQSPLLTTHIDLSADTCTALIVDKLLDGQQRLWAIAAAFGDNMLTAARRLAVTLALNDTDTAFLQQLGTLINYNAYGNKVAELHIDPATLFRQLVGYHSPWALRDDFSSPYYVLQAAYARDMQQLSALMPAHNDDVLLLYRLPDAPWAKRISGVLGNQLANANPDKAIAIVTDNPDSTLMISLRAPLNNRQGAGTLCSRFVSGGGRAAAAGINTLPAQQLALFRESVIAYYARG